jgi:hypothetical protein
MGAASTGSAIGGGGGSCAVPGSATSSAGFTAFTSRGRSTAGAGFGGSGALPPLPAGFLAAGASANIDPCGSVMFRFRAWRSTNCRATISSMELDALFTSMPVSFLSRSIASWLPRPSSSATL